jgi:hypothetical protein
MNIKQLLCCIALTACAPMVLAEIPADSKPAAASSSVPAGKRDATTFTQEQIKEISSSVVLQRMIVGYESLGDVQRLAWTLERLSELYPSAGDVRLNLAAAYAKLDDKSKTYDLLLKMKEQGFGYDVSTDPRFEKVRGTKVWDYVVSNLQSNLKTFGEGKVAFTLPKGDTLFESIAWDPKRKKFLVGSVREGKIYLSDDKGKLEPFIAPADGSGLWSVYAMSVDAERDLLYVASTSSLYFKGFRQEDLGKAAIFKFKLSTGKLISKFMMPGGQNARSPSSMTVSKNGQVFVADGLRKEIYKIEGDELKLIVANPNLTSIRGLAATDDGNTLYFADYTLGIFGADLKSGKGFPVAYDSTRLVLGGIEGLYWYDGTLVAIENGMSPRRVIRLTVSSDGKTITKMMPLDVANPAFKMPTYGTIAGEGLYFIANTQQALYGQYGDLTNESKLEAVNIFRSNLRFAWGESGIKTTGLVPAKVPSAEEAKRHLQTPPSLLRDMEESEKQRKEAEAKPTPIEPKKD